MKCLCYSRCLLGPKYTLDFHVCCKCFGDALYYFFLNFLFCPATIIVLTTGAQECCTSQARLESFFGEKLNVQQLR